jgi:hypothetical protein
VLGLIVYLYTAYCLREIARKRAVPRPWFAWVPVLNVYLLCSIVGHGIVWTVMMFVPLVNVVFWVLVALRLAKVCGRRRLYGVLFLIPLVNYVVLWSVAFGHRGTVPPGPVGGPA